MNKNEDMQSDIIKAIIDYLDCQCRYFEPMDDDEDIMEVYYEARKRGEKEGFVPVFVSVNPILWECLIINSDSDFRGNYDFDANRVAEYRKQVLSEPLEDGRTVMENMIKQVKEYCEEDGIDWISEIMGTVDGGFCIDRFSSYWDYKNKKTQPLVLAELPVKNPWEIFAYIPFGGWNECPDTKNLMAVCKYWFEEYGAVPAVISSDELEFELPSPVSREKAVDLAIEHFAWCPDRVDQCQPDDPTIGTLADTLSKSDVWYFWWD